MDSTGVTVIYSIADAPWPSTVQQDLVEQRLVWVTPYTGTYYLRVQSDVPTGTRQYQFRMTSSQLGYGVARESVSNLRSYQFIIDNSNNVLYQGPTPASRQDGESLTYLTGTISPPQIIVGASGSLDAQFSHGFSVTEVFFYDKNGELNADPETPAAHIHWGTPSGDYADAQDDIEWNYDPANVALNIGPNNTAFPNQNDTLGSAPHNFVVDITEFSGTLQDDIMHLLLGHEWYIDAHFHSQFQCDPTPLVVSRPQGGISIFDSKLLLNGFETVPQTGSSRTLEVYYNDEHQVFYIPYGLSSSLAGNAIHVHSGAPGEVGSLLIDLGTVPAPKIRPVYEPELNPQGPYGTNLFTPGIENIIKQLTDAETVLLTEGTFTTGWYIDLHSYPFFVAHPEIRNDAILHDNLEVATTRLNFYISPR